MLLEDTSGVNGAELPMEMDQFNTPARGINLHPSGNHIASLKSYEYDVIVIGSGPAGRTLSERTAAKGLSSLIIESELVGGDCPFWACVPSKALLRPLQTLDAARAVHGSAELVSSDKVVDADAAFARRDKIVRNWDDDFFVQLSAQAKVDVMRGVGRLSGPKTVTVEAFDHSTIDIKARYAVVLGTGSVPVIPDIPGLLASHPWTSRDALSANQAPDHLLILGGGVVGCEMATAYVKFGSRITLVATSPNILPNYEPQAGIMVCKSFEKLGVEVKTATRIADISTDDEKQTTVTTCDGDVFTGVKIMIATGRRPRLADCGLQSLGIAASVKELMVDDTLCVNAAPGKWLYAIGDCNGRATLTHMGAYQARCAAEAIIARQLGTLCEDSLPGPWSRYTATADHQCVSQVVFTDPIIAKAGITLSEARKMGVRAKEVTAPFRFPGALLHGDNYEGWAQWVVNTETKTLVGATFVGRDATDLLHASTVAIVGEVSLHRLRHAIPSFPTMSEIYVQLFNACDV